MRFSVTLVLLGMFMAGSQVLATPEVFDDYSLETRDVDIEDLDAREVMEPYMDVAERDLFGDDLEDFYAREYLDQDLYEREDLEGLLDYVTREDEAFLEARNDWDEFEERDFGEDEAELMGREEGFDGVELDAREPLRYRIGVVVQNHNE